MAGGPVFLVGSSRSGTALLQAILNNADVHLAGETHYFDDLRLQLRVAQAGPSSPMPSATTSIRAPLDPS